MRNKRQIENYKWQTNDKWWTIYGKGQITNNDWRMTYDEQWTMNDKLWTMNDKQQQTMNTKRQTTNDEWRTADGKRRTTSDWQWTTSKNTTINWGVVPTTTWKCQQKQDLSARVSAILQLSSTTSYRIISETLVRMFSSHQSKHGYGRTFPLLK